jgi:hypothetical protein
MFAVGEWVEAEKFPGSFYRGKIKSQPSGEDGEYEVEFPGFSQPRRLPPSLVRPQPGAAPPRAARASRRATERRSAPGLSEPPRASISSTISRLRETDQAAPQEAAPPARVAQEEEPTSALASYRRPAARPEPEPYRPAAAPEPEERPVQPARPAVYAASRDGGDSLALSVAKEARAVADELARRLDEKEKAWAEREQWWEESLLAEEQQRVALEEALEAERERLAVEQQRGRDVAHDMLGARTQLDELRSDFQDHKDLFKAAVKPLQEAVPALQQETAALQEEMNLAGDEIAVLVGAAEQATAERAEHKNLVQESETSVLGRLAKLQAESDDQRDAIGALMDLLEKTMTVDDASELHDQLSAAVRERAEELASRCDEQAQVAADIDERLASTAEGLMKQIKGVGADAEKEEARLEKLIASNNEAQTARSTEIETALTAAVEQNLAKADGNATELSERLEQSSAKLTKALETLDVELRSQCTAVAEATKEEFVAAKKVTDEQHHQLSVKADDTATELRAKMAQTKEELSDKLDTTTDVLRARVESSVTSLSKEMKSTSTTLVTQVRDLTAFVSKETSGVIRRLDEQTTELRERTEDEKVRVNDLVDKEVRALYGRMETGIGEMDQRVSAMDEKIDKTTNELATSVHEQLTRQDTQMRGLSTQVDKTLEQLLKGQQATHLEVQQFVIEVGLDKEITQASISRVDSKLGDVAHKLTKDLQEHRAHVTKLTAETAEAMETKNAEQDSTIQLHHSQLLKDSANLSEKMLGYNADYDLRLRDIMSKTDQFEQATQLQVKRLGDEMAVKDTVVQRELETLKTNLPEQVRLLDEKTRARAEAVDQHFERDREHMLELTTELGKRITAKTSEVTNMVRTVEEQTKSAAASLDSQLSDALAQLQTATTDRAVRHDQRLDLLERDTTSTQQEVRKTTKNVELLDSGLQNLQRESAEAVARLDQQQNARGNTVDEKFRMMQERMQDSAKDLRTTILTTGSTATLAADQLASKISAVEASQEKSLASLVEKLAGIEQKAEDNHLQVVQTHRALDEKLSQRCTTNENRLANHQQQREADIGDITTKMEAAAVSLDARLAAFTEKTTDAQKNLAVLYDEKHDLHTKAAKEATSLVERCQANLTTTCASLEKRFTAKDNALEKQLGDLRHRIQERQQQWTQAHNDLEAAQHEKHMQSEKHADEQWQQLTRICNDLDKRLDAVSQEHKDRQEEMHSSLVKSHEELQDRHVAESEKLAAAVSTTAKDVAHLSETTAVGLNDLESKSATLQTKLSALQSDHQSRIEHVATKSQERLEQVSEAVRQRATKAETDVSSLAAALESESRKTGNVLSNVDTRLSELSAASDAALHEVNSRLASRLDEVDRKTESQLQQHQAQIVEVRSGLSALEASTSTMLSSLEAKSANAVASLAEKTADQHQSHVTGLADMETTLVGKIQTVSTLQSELSETVASNHKHITGATAQLERTIKERSTEETRRIDSQLASVGESIRQLEKLSTEKTQAVARELDVFMNETGATTEQIRTLMGQLDVRVSSKLESHGESLADLRKEHAQTVKDLTARSDANDKEHSDLLDRLKEQMASGLQGLKDQCVNTEAAGTKVLQDATAEMAKVQADLQQELSALGARVFTKIQGTDARVDSVLRSLQDDKRTSTDVLSTLAMKLSKHENSIDLRVTALDSQLGETTQRLDLQIRESQDTLSRRLDEVQDEIGRDRLQFNRSLEAQESKFDAAIGTHDSRIKDQHEHFTKIATATATVLNDTCKALESSMTERLKEVQLELLDKIKATDQQAEKNKFEVFEMHRELKASTHEQARLMVEQSLEQQAKLDSQQSHFTSVTNEIKADASERDNREALRHETLSGMLEVEVKRVATAQAEQEIRFTSQLADVRSSTDKLERKVSTELAVIAKDSLASAMSLQEETARQSHRLADLEGKSRLETDRLDKTMHSLHRTTGQALESSSKAARTERSRLERELKDLVGEHSRTAQAERQVLTESLQSLSAAATASELKSSGRVDSLGKELADAQSSASAMFEQKLFALTTRLDTNDKKDLIVTKVIAALRADLETEQKTAASATHTLQLATEAKMDEQADQQKTACAKLDDAMQAIAANLQVEVGRAQDEEKRQAARIAEVQTDLETLCKEEASTGKSMPRLASLHLPLHLPGAAVVTVRVLIGARTFVCCVLLSARRDAVREVVEQLSPAIEAAQATLLVKCDKTELKTQMMMVDNDLKDLTQAFEVLVDEVRDEEPAKVIDDRLDELDADVADVSAEVSILSAMVESVN